MVTFTLVCQKSRKLKFMRIQYIGKIFDCSMLRGQVRMIQLRQKTVDFPMVQDTDRTGSSMSQLQCETAPTGPANCKDHR